MNRLNTPQSGEGDSISILLVDDIAETRENIRKLLAFESDFKVVGSVGTGREAVTAARDLKPDIVIMDINMPDMDGIQATSEITKIVPTAAVIIMSVQNDQDYLRKAMLAGARNFLVKPIDTDELYNTIRSVYQGHATIRAQYKFMEERAPLELIHPRPGDTGGSVGDQDRPGHVILVYSAQGGAGCTTIATNLASGMMKKGIKVLLVDADLEFGDVGVFLKLQAQTTLRDLVPKVEDLDIEFFDSVIATHESGLKVLLGPPRPEFAEEVEAVPDAVSRIVEKVSSSYDFIVIDTGRHLGPSLLSLMDIASKIVLVATPTLAGIKNARFVLDLFDKLHYPTSKTIFVLNRTEDERARGRVTIPSEVIEKHLKMPIQARIPLNEHVVLNAVNKGVPVIASQRDRNQSPIKELLEFSDKVYNILMGAEQPEMDEADGDKNKRRPGLGLRMGGKA